VQKSKQAKQVQSQAEKILLVPPGAKLKLLLQAGAAVERALRGGCLAGWLA
jgi:hypothetical protein